MKAQEIKDQVGFQGIAADTGEWEKKILRGMKLAHAILMSEKAEEQRFGFTRTMRDETGESICTGDAVDAVGEMIKFIGGEVAEPGEEQVVNRPVDAQVSPDPVKARIQASKMIYDTAEKIRELAEQPRRKKVLFGLTKAQALFLYNLAKMEHRVPSVESRIKKIESDPGEIIYARLCYYNARLETASGECIANIDRDDTVKFLIDRKIGGVEL